MSDLVLPRLRNMHVLIKIANHNLENHFSVDFELEKEQFETCCTKHNLIGSIDSLIDIPYLGQESDR